MGGIHSKLVRVCMCAHICTCVCACLCVCAHLYLCVCVCVHKCTCIFLFMELEENIGITHFLIINNLTLGKFCVPIISFSGARTF